MLALLLATLLLAETPATDLTGPESTGRVRIVTTFEGRRLIERLDAALEDGVLLFEAWTGFALHADQPLVLLLHPDIDSYRVALESHGVEQFRDTGAVTLWSNDESHVVIQPRAEPGYLDAVEHLPELTLQLALHELLHQFVQRTTMYPTKHQPLWYSEGMAEAFSARAMRVLAGDRPLLWVDDAAALLVEARDERRLLPLPELLADAFETAGPERRGLAYAQCGSFFAFLSESPATPWASRFARFEEELHALPAPDRKARPRWSRGRLDRRFRSELGALDALELAWRAQLTSQPTWRQRGRASQWVGEELVVASFGWGDEALALAPDAMPLDGLRLGCEILLPEAGERDAFVAFAADPLGENRLELRLRGTGEALLAVRQAGAWRTLAGAKLASLELVPLWHAVSIEADGRRVRVHVDGCALFDVDLDDDLVLAGDAWGVGTWRSAARFASLPSRPGAADENR